MKMPGPSTNPSELAREFREIGWSESCPITDMHAHLGPFRGIYFPDPSPEGMIHSMDRCGVRTVVTSGHFALDDSERGNEEVAEAVRNYPDRFKGYFVINPNDPELVERQLAELPGRREFIGIKLHPTMHNYPLSGERYDPVYRFAQEHRMPILAHTWGDNGPCGAGQVRTVAEKHPDLVFLMGHACYGSWEKACAIAIDFQNYYLELTAAYAAAGSIEYMVEKAGSHKVIYGTDHPWFDPHYAIGCVLYAHITDEDRHNIFHRNADKLLPNQAVGPQRISDRQY